MSAGLSQYSPRIQSAALCTLTPRMPEKASSSFSMIIGRRFSNLPNS